MLHMVDHGMVMRMAHKSDLNKLAIHQQCINGRSSINRRRLIHKYDDDENEALIINIERSFIVYCLMQFVICVNSCYIILFFLEDI